MAANENNSQVNTFVKGMNSDMSYSMLPEGQYTYAENIRITALGSGAIENGQGAVRPIEGVSNINLEDIHATDILATDTIRNYGVIVYTGTDSHWHVGRFDSNTEKFVEIFDSGETPTVNKFSIVTHYETDELIKLYIADGVNPIKMLNIVDPVIDGVHLIDPHKVESYPRVIFQPMEFMGLINGTLKSGMVQYAYQLYNKHGIATDISPTTNLIPIINKNTLSGYAEGKTTNCGVKLYCGTHQVDLYDKIKIFRIHYLQNGQLPTVEIIVNSNINSFNRVPSSGTEAYNIFVEDYGQSALQTITLEEFNSLSGVHIIPKVIEDKNDYLFAAAIKDVRQSSFDELNSGNVHLNYELVYADLVEDSIKEFEQQYPQDYVKENNIIQRISDVNNFNFGGAVNNSVLFNKIRLYMGQSQNNKHNYGYSNPIISYYAKSFRRGETYRFGVVFYNDKGESSGVIQSTITDIVIPSVQDEPIFAIQEINTNQDALITKPCGIKFTIEGIPQDTEAVAYEIVRCRRTINDTKNISQGVISRPVKKVEYEKDTDEFFIKNQYPYTPSGFLTIQNIAFSNEKRIFLHNVGRDDLVDLAADKYEGASNIDTISVLQFVSPEISYNPDSLKEVMKDDILDIEPLCGLYADNFGNTISSQTSTDLITYDQTVYNGRFKAAKNNTNLEFVTMVDHTLQDNTAPILCIAGYNYPSTFYRVDPYSWETNRFSEFDKDSATNNTNEWSWINPGQYTDTRIESKNIRPAKKSAYSYIKLYNIIDLPTYGAWEDLSYGISDSIVSDSIQWNEVYKYDNGNITNTYEDFLQVVGTNTYNNVVIGGWYGNNVKDNINTSADNEYEPLQDDIVFAGIGGPCAVLNINSDFNISPADIDPTINETDSRYMMTILCNICRNTTPYGGSTADSKKLNTFYSYGEYHEINDTTDIISFIGDTYIEPFEYVSMHKAYLPEASDTLASHMIAYSIPVETSINLAYTHGNELSKNYTDSGITNVQVEPASVYNVYNQKEPLYAYNTVYSNNTTARLFAVRDDEDDLSIQDNMDYRVYHSNLKENGEYIDSWLKFQPSNYLDADSQYGPITHMRNFHDKLIFWQQSAMGLFSVNERTLTTDDSNLPLILGTGGVLTRYDYIDNTAGMKEEQYCDTMSDSTLYWYDDHNNEIKAYQNGTGVLSLTKQFGVQNLMHNHDDNNKPWMFYDKKYSEVVLDFAQEPKRSIVFNEQVKAFTSIYTVGFDGALAFKDGIYMLDLNGDYMQIGKWDEGDVTDFYDNKLKTKIVYVVNKNPLTTKVFDNQELGSYYRNDVFTDDSYFYLNHVYKWKSDLNETLNIYDLPMTTREGNYRFAIPRADGRNWGNRIRGKYMICSIEDRNPNKDVSLSYILTKFRTSWS